MPPGTTTFACPCCSSGDTSGTNCASLKKCFQEYGIVYDCTSDTFGAGAWTVGLTFCLPIATSTALRSIPSGDTGFPCTLLKYVPANGTARCCITDGDCSGFSYTAPALPTNPEAAGCCCCDCPGDCTGCGTTRTVTIAGTGGAYDGGGNHFDGTFTLRACAPRAAGDPCTDTISFCQWFLDTSFETGGVPSGNNDIVLFCTGPDWGINFGVCTAIVKRCCPTVNCPPSGAYVCNCAGVTVSLS